MYEKATFVCFIYMQPQKLKFKSVQINMNRSRILIVWERNGSVVECLTLDREAAGSSLTDATVLWSLSKTHLS